MESYRLLVHSATEIVQVVSNGERVVKGNSMGKIAVLKGNEQGYSIVVDREGKIVSIGHDAEIRCKYKDEQFENIINASNKCIIPGLVDGHTHAVWAGDRVHEFAMKLAGASYMEVHAAGGGILYTVDHVRRASEDDLYTSFKHLTRQIVSAGTTLLECKSGYGLDAETELKMLRVLNRGRKDPDVAVDISATYCGAHAVPKGNDPAESTDDVINVQIPKLKSAMENEGLQVDNIDVFCEKGVFDLNQTRRILQAGKNIGLAINFHGEELSRLYSAEMGAEIGAQAISHLEEISDSGIEAMAKSGCVGVVLPTTAFILRLQPPPVRKMIDAGMIIALGSDLNPNAHCFAMPIVMYLACVILRMSMPEALVASTINAAASLLKSSTHGSLEVGKFGDMVLIDALRWEHLIYQLGSYHHVISHVVKNGRVVYKRSDS